MVRACGWRTSHTSPSAAANRMSQADGSTNGHGATSALDDATATAAEAAATTAAEADALTTRIKKTTSDVVEGGSES